MYGRLYILSSLNTLKINSGICILSEVLAKFTLIFAKIFVLCSEVSSFESRLTTILKDVSHVAQESVIKSMSHLT